MLHPLQRPTDLAYYARANRICATWCDYWREGEGRHCQQDQTRCPYYPELDLLAEAPRPWPPSGAVCGNHAPPRPVWRDLAAWLGTHALLWLWLAAIVAVILGASASDYAALGGR